MVIRITQTVVLLTTCWLALLCSPAETIASLGKDADFGSHTRMQLSNQLHIFFSDVYLLPACNTDGFETVVVK